MAQGFRCLVGRGFLMLRVVAFAAFFGLLGNLALAAPQAFPLPGDVTFGTPHLRGQDSCVTFSPDGKFAVAAGTGPIRFWDISTGLIDHELESSINFFQSICYSPNGKLLAAGGRGGVLAVWDAETKEEVFKNKPGGNFEYSINCLVFSPDSDRLLTGTQDARMQVWDAQSGELLHEVRQSGDRRTSTVVAWSPGGKYIAATDFGKIHVYDAETYDEVHMIPAHQRAITGLAFTSDAQLVSAGTETNRVDGALQQLGVVRIWKMSRGSLLRQLKFADTPVNVETICLSPDGEHVVMHTRNDIRIVRLSDAEVVRQFGSFGADTVLPQGLAISGNGAYVARTTSSSSTVELYDTESASRVTYAGAAGHDERVSLMLVSPDSSTLVTISADGRLLFWDAQSGEYLSTFHCGPDTFPQSAVWSADGEKLYVAGGQSALNQPRGFLVGIHARDQAEFMRAGFDNQAMACALSPDGGELAVCVGINRQVAGVPTAQSTLQILSSDTGQVFARIDPTIAYGHLRFSADGRQLLAARSNYGETLDFWDLREGRAVRKEPLVPYRACAFSASSDRFVLYAADDQSRVFTAPTMKQLAVVKEPNRRYPISRLSPDGQLLATWATQVELTEENGRPRQYSTNKRELSVWNIETRELINRESDLELDVTDIQFSPDGRRLYMGLRNGVAIGWNLPE